MADDTILAHDLDGIYTRLVDGWQALRGARLFMTGGTGFIGRWMLDSLALANARDGLDVKVVVLTRDPARFAHAAPHLAGNPAFHFVAGDVLSLDWDGARYSHVIHAATDASAALNEQDPRRMFDTVLTGTRAALDFAVAAKARRVLFLSSGAVYGPQPWDMSHVAEDDRGGPDPTTHRSAYGEGKRAAEVLCAIYRQQFGLDIVTARIFALLGPLLSLDIHFAAGNFILDAVAGRTVTVNGDGRAVRSYLYIADLVTWLWAMLLRAPGGATYNLGSEDAVSIADLAERTARLLRGDGHRILGQPDLGWNPGRYVPSTARFRTAMQLAPTVALDEAILRTAQWNGWTR
jgi:dTDP-glucose 4,6-dehydratase